MNISDVVARQRNFFDTRKTFDINFRKLALEKLKHSIESNYNELFEAFIRDFGKCKFDVISTEIMLVMSELGSMLKNISRYARVKKVGTSLINFPSKGRIIPQPFGVALIVSPWNYPFQLAMIPLIGAIAAGNCVVLKPSNSSLNVSSVIKKILSVFDESYIYVTMGDRNANDDLFDQKFDFAFFTGGSKTAKRLMSKLSNNLTPAVLELGGKSPCIVDESADLDATARRVVWAKFLNAGQTCVAPDYVLLHSAVRSEFLKKVIFEIESRYYINGKLTGDFPQIISQSQLDRIMGLVDTKKLVFGGKSVRDRTLEPTILDNVSFDDPVMQEEIFGPVLPIIEFTSLVGVVDKFKEMEYPLALYYFGEDKKKQKFVMKNALYGGGCINDAVMHVSEENLPFGGVGNSGMGRYHGKKSFEVFSHMKSVLIRHPRLEIRLKYMPYTETKMKILKWFAKMK